MFTELNGYRVELDDDIAESIIELNKKGYETFACCSGHNTKDSWYGYIYFNTRLLKKYGKPDGWYYEKELFPEAVIEERGRKNLIRYIMFDDENKKEVIKIMMTNLKLWVDNLEDTNK